MAALMWDETKDRLFETGVSKGVLYLRDNKGAYATGVAWNGLTSVSESPDGAEANDLWADDMKYAVLRGPETFGGTIEAYTYPDEFNACDGNAEPVPGLTVGQQSRAVFGMCYRTRVGSADDPDATNYKLHLVYGATASPSERQYESMNDSPDAITFSWEFETTPVPVAGCKPTSVLTINSLKMDKTKLAALEKVLYGDETSEARLPLPDEVITMMKGA